MDPAIAAKGALMVDLQDFTEATADLLESYPLDEFNNLPVEVLDQIKQHSNETLDSFETHRERSRELALTRDVEVHPLLRLGSQQCTQVKRMLIRVEACKETLRRAAEAPAPPPAAPGAAPLQVNLKPTTKAPIFDGKRASWHTWWATFRSLVDIAPHYSNLEKYSLLRQALGEAALSVIGHPPVDEDAYAVCVDRLKKEYQYPSSDRVTLLNEFRLVPNPNGQPQDLKRFLRGWRNATEMYRNAPVRLPMRMF